MRSFHTDIRQQAKYRPGATALVDERSGQKITHGTLIELLERAAGFLRSCSATADRPLLSLLPNSTEALVVFLGAMYAGVGFAPASHDATASEIESWARLTRPSLCVASDATRPDVLEVLKSLGVAVRVIDLDNAFRWLPALASPSSPPESPGRLYLTTSGSTGTPQAMVIDGDRLWSSGYAFAKHHRFLDHQAVFLNILPVSYLGGLFNLCYIPLAAGASAIVAEPFSGKTFLTFWQTVEKFDVNVLWLVPTIVRGLLAIADRTKRHEFGATPKIRAAFLGTAPIDLATKQRFEQTFGLRLLENFALSETTFFTSETLDTCHRRVEGSVGEQLPDVEIALVPLDSEVESDGHGDTPAKAPAEIGVKSPYLMLGYLQADGSLSLPLDENGFFPTKDLGHFDGATLVIDGRKRDIIKKGGLMVSLREIERIAETHPDVAEAIAVGRPHEFYGETYQLYVRLKTTQNAASAVDSIGRHVRAHLTKYKWPNAIEAVDHFPRTRSGKIQKHLIASASGKAE